MNAADSHAADSSVADPSVADPSSVAVPRADAEQPPSQRRPLTVALGILLLLGVVAVAVTVIPVPRWDLWLVGVVALLGGSLGLLVIALMPREISRPAADEADATSEQ